MKAAPSKLYGSRAALDLTVLYHAQAMPQDSPSVQSHSEQHRRSVFPSLLPPASLAWQMWNAVPTPRFYWEPSPSQFPRESRDLHLGSSETGLAAKCPCDSSASCPSVEHASCRSNSAASSKDLREALRRGNSDALLDPVPLCISVRISSLRKSGNSEKRLGEIIDSDML